MNAIPPPDPEDAVRLLLADARHDEPMPAEVAARMDAVLADLASDHPADPEAPRAAAPAPAPEHPVVVSLTAARRRRAAAMLVAAAAIVVGGVVVAQHLPTRGTEAGSTAGAEADRGSSRAGNTGGDSQPSDVPSAQDLAGARPQVRHGRVVVRPQHFSSDAFAARRLIGQKRSAPRADMLSQAASSCLAARAHGTVVKATYQRAPALLVFRRPVSNSQVVDLFLCGSDRPVRSATLPRR